MEIVEKFADESDTAPSVALDVAQGISLYTSSPMR